jgi:hypothetical protein
MARRANAARHSPICRVVAAKCSNSATLPGRAKGESWGWSALDVMLYYYVMTHHHHGGAPHPSPAISPSLLRLAVSTRLALAGFVIALIWAAVLWATR